jgi:adenosine deaminase
VNRGLEQARDEFNQLPAVASGQEPPYDYGIIACALRMFDANFSAYYNQFMQVHAYSPSRAAHSMASMELARAMVRVRDELGLPIVGFDLAGCEDGFPAHAHVSAYRHAHRNFMHKTVHAGEAYGPESIFEAITLLHADRIGHGFHLFSKDKINCELGEGEDEESYVRELSEYIADRRITLEVCLTSNLQTNPALSTLADHPWRKMNDARISTTFCTDNRLVSNTSLTREISLAAEHLGLTPNELKNCVIYGFKRSFMRQNYIAKRRYVRRIIDYYDEIERRFGFQ